MDNRALAFASLLQIGLSQTNLREIMERNLDVVAFLHDFDAAVLESLGIRSDRAERILSQRATFDPVRFSATLESLGVRIVLRDNADYPSLLAPCPAAPAALFVLGELPAMPMLAVVGSRTPTDYSGRVLRQWIPSFVSEGFAIVSGGAYGVDSLAHSIALESGGCTVAVLGTGIDVAHPVSHGPLYRRIAAEGGAVVSEFPLGTPGANYTFPIRNATIAGLSHAVLVTEAAEKSGSLITARLANDFGREVFALPGDIFRSASAGTNSLIRAGEAMAATSAADVIGAIGFPSVRPAAVPAELPTCDDPLDTRILSALRTRSLGMDALAETLAADLSELSVRLAELEFRDILIRHPHGNYEFR